jgi:hypothetical protein
MTRHACAYWREETKRGAGRAGRIINTTSGTGLFGTVGQANYRAAKAANASGLVVYLASDAASWLTGQVFRVHGHRVQRLRGWRSAGEYRSSSGRAVEPEELITGLPEVYGTVPAGRLPDPAVHGA